MQIVINNEFEKNVIKSGNDLMIVNPTNKVKVYTIVVDSPASADKALVIVQPSSYEQVTITPNAKGDYNFDVNVLSGGKVVDTINFSGSTIKKINLLSKVSKFLTYNFIYSFYILKHNNSYK